MCIYRSLLGKHLIRVGSILRKASTCARTSSNVLYLRHFQNASKTRSYLSFYTPQNGTLTHIVVLLFAPDKCIVCRLILVGTYAPDLTSTTLQEKNYNEWNGVVVE